MVIPNFPMAFSRFRTPCAESMRIHGTGGQSPEQCSVGCLQKGWLPSTNAHPGPGLAHLRSRLGCDWHRQELWLVWLEWGSELRSFKDHNMFIVIYSYYKINTSISSRLPFLETYSFWSVLLLFLRSFGFRRSCSHIFNHLWP